jgi:hypothetical protein
MTGAADLMALNCAPVKRIAKKLAVKAGVTIVEKDEVSHTLVSFKKKWLQKLEARGKRCAIETMTIAIDDFLAMTGHTYPDLVIRTLGEVFRLKHVQGTNFSAAVAMPYLGGAFNSCLLLLGRPGLVLLPTLYSVLLDRASDRNHSAGVQNCHDRLVMAAQFDTEPKSSRPPRVNQCVADDALTET